MKKNHQQEGITPKSGPATHNLIIASLGLFISGMLIFYTLAFFDDNELWDTIYYLWDKTKDLLFLICIYRLCAELRGTIKLIIAFATLRLLWEVIKIIIKVDANHRVGVNILWLMLVGCTVILSIKELLREWKQKS